jgi:hypothetical protein
MPTPANAAPVSAAVTVVGLVPPQPAVTRTVSAADDRGEHDTALLPHRWLVFVHPFAWSRINAVKAGAFFGATWNASAHFPTITSAGAARE